MLVCYCDYALISITEGWRKYIKNQELITYYGPTRQLEFL